MNCFQLIIKMQRVWMLVVVETKSPAEGVCGLSRQLPDPVYRQAEGLGVGAA